MPIWAIFSVKNDYNQPDNNLEKWYKNKPTFDVLLSFFYKDTALSDLNNNQINDLDKLLDGNRVNIFGDEYRLEVVEVSND